MLVYVVSREHVPVFESLERAYSEDPEVSVLLDRRVDERRRSATRRPDTRRSGERRAGAEQDELHALGWVRIDPDAAPGALARFVRQG